MKLFISYAKEDREVARELATVLRTAGHGVFFDRTELSSGAAFHVDISKQVRSSDALIFLITHEALQPGRYPLIELELAERRWPNPTNRVIPVLAGPVDRNQIPGYLRAVTILDPSGPLAPTVLFHVQALQRKRLWKRFFLTSLAVSKATVWNNSTSAGSFRFSTGRKCNSPEPTCA